MSSFDEIDGEDLEDVGITVNRSDGDISEEVECTNTERHDDYDALNLFRLLSKSIGTKVGQRFGRHIDVSVDIGEGKRIHYTLIIYLSGISKLYTVCEKVNPNLERSSKALENAFWLLSQKLAEED
ncbi:hypothetical protein Tco_1154137 [Tanacetum coccineum]